MAIVTLRRDNLSSKTWSCMLLKTQKLFSWIELDRYNDLTGATNTLVTQKCWRTHYTYSHISMYPMITSVGNDACDKAAHIWCNIITVRRISLSRFQKDTIGCTITFCTFCPPLYAIVNNRINHVDRTGEKWRTNNACTVLWSRSEMFWISYPIK